MDKKQKLSYQKGIQQYLTNQNVYDLFQQLLKTLIVKQPEDPISFLIDRLANPEAVTKKVFLVGPPGFKVREFALQVADHYKFTTISVGDLLKKEVSKKLELGEQIQSYFKNFSLVKDQIVINLVKKQIQAIQKQKKNIILSGFPKTRAQGLAMQKAGIFPDAFLILNMDTDKMASYCQQKFKSSQKILDRHIISQKSKHIQNHCLQYKLNISQIKQIYSNNYFQIDGNNSNREQILQDMARLLKFKIKSKRPKRPAAILLLGGTHQQRSTISLKLSKRYGFTYISARQLLIQQIGKSTEVGRLSLQKIRKGQLIEDNIINGLVQNRLQQVDCQMQGYVLEGYPKTEGQGKALSDNHLKPTLIVQIAGGKSTYGQVNKEIGEKFANFLLKVNGEGDNQQIFEKVCFELENN